MTATISTSQDDAREDTDYELLRARVCDTFVAQPMTLFTTDAEGLYDAFLKGLHPAHRQHYECRACRSFFDRFGALVTIDEHGGASSPLWWFDPRAGSLFAESVRGVASIIARARVTGVFFAEETVWGTARNVSAKAPGGVWSHTHVVPHRDMLFRATPLRNAHQAMAEKREDFGTLSRGLAEFPIELVRQAYTLLTSGALYRSEKCIGVASWLLELHEARERTKNKASRENLTWRAVAAAPPGYCHVRSTMISTLLEDLAAGKAFDDIKRAFDSKMNPLQYQRPQAAPTDGQIAAAEVAIAKLASAGALARRYATLEEILPRAIWTPKPAKDEVPKAGVFGHLKGGRSTAPAPLAIPPQTMTWEKFARTVLPEAERIAFEVPHSVASFFAFVTSVDPAAPPILQWDREDRRNPVSWYVYPSGSTAAHWNLALGTWVDVTAITLQPSAWDEALEHQGNGAYFVLAGARDTAPEGGLAIFPECLRSEYHGIRAVLEAHSRAGKLAGAELATACGLALQKKTVAGFWNATFRVTVRGQTLSYRLDRWD